VSQRLFAKAVLNFTTKDTKEKKKSLTQINTDFFHSFFNKSPRHGSVD
jgi:hypothetical protein